MVREARTADVDLAQKFAAFVLERYPLVATVAIDAMTQAQRRTVAEDDRLNQLRKRLGTELRHRLGDAATVVDIETTPGVSASARLQRALDDFVTACDGFLARMALQASLTSDERREILRGMILTRATDNRLKSLFTGGDVRYGEAAFQGKGFRSLGQEAIYAAGVRLRRGEKYCDGNSWRGDVVAPLIRDLGVALAMRPAPETIRIALSAQLAKAGPPMNGKDFHIGDISWGILPATAPLGIGTLTMAGMAMAFWREGTGRVALSFIGEGGSSLGEWHEAINLCAARRLPAVFCVENNQTALSTPVHEQSAVRVFADKAIGYGIPGITIDGTDPDEIAAAFGWAVERARDGKGPALIELVCMRMCGHAHHDDMLYHGKDHMPSWDYPALSEQGYADASLYEFWRGRDPLVRYAARLHDEGIIRAGEVDEWKREATALVEEQTKIVVAAPWPPEEDAGAGVYASEQPRRRRDPLNEDAGANDLPTMPLA